MCCTLQHGEIRCMTFEHGEVRSNKTKGSQKSEEGMTERLTLSLSTKNAPVTKHFLFVSQDNDAVNKMIMEGRSPTMRHVSHAHRVALDWLFDRINLDSMVQVKFVDTTTQIAGPTHMIFHS